jgi:hypothetical protein
MRKPPENHTVYNNVIQGKTIILEHARKRVEITKAGTIMVMISQGFE